MKFLGVIPARYKSTRLERKILSDICGYPMIEWVYRRAKKSKLDKVVVATDSKEIYDVVKSFGGEVVLTSEKHKNGTSRIAEVCESYKDYEYVINIQGDEPLIKPEMINSLIEGIEKEPNLKMITLKHQIKEEKDISNPNFVKVVTDKNDYALYFSRSVIPYPRNENKELYFKHIGIYGYSREFILEYSKMQTTPLEDSESLEQLRVLENGYKIKVLETKHQIIGVDTQEELDKVKEFIMRKGIILK